MSQYRNKYIHNIFRSLGKTRTGRNPNCVLPRQEQHLKIIDFSDCSLLDSSSSCYNYTRTNGIRNLHLVLIMNMVIYTASEELV